MRIIFVCLLFAFASANAENVLLKADGFIDVRSGELIKPADILIRDGRIAEINGDAQVEDATIVDLPGKILLPGLMDMHVHLQGELGPNRDRDTLKMSRQLMQMRSLYYAMNTLKAGSSNWIRSAPAAASSPASMFRISANAIAMSERVA